MFLNKNRNQWDVLITLTMGFVFQFAFWGLKFYVLYIESIEGKIGGGRTFGFGVIALLFWAGSLCCMFLGVGKTYNMSKEKSNVTARFKKTTITFSLFLFLIVLGELAYFYFT